MTRTGQMWARGLSTYRWWVRNTTTQQVLGSVFAAVHDEAMGKAQVKYGIDLYSRDGFTLTEAPHA